MTSNFLVDASKTQEVVSGFFPVCEALVHVESSCLGVALLDVFFGVLNPKEHVETC